ncbi:seipin-2 isoform X2 [Gossypium raimondii]|uniref:seipin-2 isoform X2 n=1 Tax=Gossypium raimondii TaxID=29730 RepID=UPI00227BAA21|nr:seipin-2 isoform X2 [Gossypium raimondii]
MESQNTNEIEQISDDIPSHNSVTVGESDPSASALSSTLRHRLFSRQGTTSKEPAVDSLVKEIHSKTYKFSRDPKPSDASSSSSSEVTVSLTLPESDYNRNLGMFQVRTDFISIKGETLDSSSHPCMMRFKSLPIRLLLTLFKAVPLVTGFISEVQTLNVKLKDLNQGTEPTACLKVVLEQRPAHGPGAGIPDLYGASLVLESKLPFIKRIIWYWRKTLFIWVSIMSFVSELLFMSVCCRCVLVPATRKTTGSTGN